MDTPVARPEVAADAGPQTLSEARRGWRRRLSSALIVGSPCLALAMTLATYWFVKFFGIELGDYVGDLFALSGSSLAFVGCAAGGMLIRRPLPVRIVAAVVAGLLGPVAFLLLLFATDYAVGWL